jgi:glutamine synthetase
MKAILPDADTNAQADTVSRLSRLISKAYTLIFELSKADDDAKSKHTPAEMAIAFRDGVIPVMNELRCVVDEMEMHTAAKDWPMPDYGDMLFSI